MHMHYHNISSNHPGYVKDGCQNIHGMRVLDIIDQTSNIMDNQ